jgi:hypothetical protein
VATSLKSPLPQVVLRPLGKQYIWITIKGLRVSGKTLDPNYMKTVLGARGDLGFFFFVW